MRITDKYECFNLEKIIEDLRDIDIKTLENNAAVEQEERIQEIVIAYLDDKNIICEPSIINKYLIAEAIIWHEEEEE